MKLIKIMFSFFFLTIPILAFADSDLQGFQGLGPSLGSIDEPKPAIVTSSASIKPFIGTPVTSKPYQLEEGDSKYLKELENAPIAKTTQRCQPNFKPFVSVSITDTDVAYAAPIRELHASGAYVIEDKDGPGYIVIVGKANVHYTASSAGGLRVHWAVSCYNNTATG